VAHRNKWILIVALGGIALTGLASHAWVTRSVEDAHLIAVAAGQRGLIQRVSTLALQIGAATNPNDRRRHGEALAETTRAWEEDYRQLRRHKAPARWGPMSEADLGLHFARIEPDVIAMQRDARALQGAASDSPADPSLAPYVERILVRLPGIEMGMDAVVQGFERRAQDRTRIFWMGNLLVIISLMIALSLEALIVFKTRPNRMRRTADRLPASCPFATHVASDFEQETSRRLELQRDIINTSENEQRRIGRDLHDDLGQHLTGAALMSKVLEKRLAGTAPRCAGDAARLGTLVNEAVDRTRALARGLCPVETGGIGLSGALTELAEQTETTSGVSCSVICTDPTYAPGDTAATHLYRITQEAINNAIRHARATAIEIRLATRDDRVTLTVVNNGQVGSCCQGAQTGMGMRTMKYRAALLNGQLDVDFGRSDRTTVEVSCPMNSTLAA
jgi:signal transduction histidine kinase